MMRQVVFLILQVPDVLQKLIQGQLSQGVLQGLILGGGLLRLGRGCFLRGGGRL